MLREQPMQPGDADIDDPLYRIAHEFGSNCGLFGYRQVAGSGAQHGHDPRRALALHVAST